MSPPVFYHMPESPCSRGALLAAHLLGVEVEVRHIDLFSSEQLKPEFLKINPQHTVPTLDDDGFIVVDSHAIATYLAEKYGTDDKLYPKDVQQRSLVDQRLYFDACVLFTRLKDVCYPVFFEGASTVSKEKKQKVKQALAWLEGFLAPTGWVAGSGITIADALCVSSVTTYLAEGFDMEEYPKVKAWIEKCRETIPKFDAVDTTGTDAFREAFQRKLEGRTEG